MESSITTAKPLGSTSKSFSLLALAVSAAIASLLVSGFEFGVHNNVYHVPYVLGWERLPQFKDDAFYQSLQYFTSAVWLVLRMFCTEGNVEAVFLVAHVLTRVATFVALALLVRQAGVTDPLRMALALVILSATAWLQQGSVVANHGLFLSYFTHSEVAWPFVLFSLYFAQQHRWTASAAHAALAFVANAFVGVWLAVILAVLVVQHFRAVSRRALASAAVIYLLIVMPVLVWVGLAVGSPAALVDFSFRDYLALYYPRHFLIDEFDAAVVGRLGLLMASALAGLCSTWLVVNGHFWRTVLTVCCAIFLAGALTPLFVDSRLVFNLHLMRVEGFIQLFSKLLIACGGIRILFDPASLAWQRGAALIGLGLLCIPWRFGLPAVAVLSLFVAVTSLRETHSFGKLARSLHRRLGQREERWQFAVLGVVMLLAAGLMGFNYVMRPTPASVIGSGLGVAGMAALWAVRHQLHGVPRLSLSAVSLMVTTLVGASYVADVNADYLHSRQARVDPVTEADWLALTDWVRDHPLDGAVLVPIEDHRDPADDYLLSYNFQLRARTPVWVDWKQGAAVMWSPQFFHRWAPRYEAARGLRTPLEFRDFARARGVPYFVPRAYEGAACPEGSATLRSSGHFKLCAVGGPSHSSDTVSPSRAARTTADVRLGAKPSMKSSA